MLLILNYLDMHIEIRSKMRHPESDQICCCQKHRDRLKKQTKIRVSVYYVSTKIPPQKNTDTLLPRRFHLSQPLSFYHLPAKILVSCSHLSFVPKLLQNSLLFQQHLSRESSLIHSVSQYWISLILQVFESRDAWFMHRLAAFCCSRNSSCRSRGTAFCFRCSRALSRPPRPSWRP